MIINVNLKSDLPNITGNVGDIVYCKENGLFYKISVTTNRPIIGDKTSVTTSVETTPPTSTSYAEVGTIRVDSTSNKIYVCANNSDTQNVVWKDVSVDDTNLVPRITSTSNPTLIDSAYKIGTIWINTSSDTVFILVDNTENNAIWNEYTKKSTIINETITMNQTAYEAKVISSLVVNSTSNIRFQFTGNDIQSYIISGITLNVISITDNTSFTIGVFAPDGFNGEVTFKIIIN